MKKLFTLLLSLSVATMLKAQAENLYYIVTDYTNNEVSVSWCEPPIEGTLEIPAYVILQNGDLTVYTVTSIGKNAFSDCTELTEVVLPPTIKRIEEYAFYKCKKLKAINIPDGVEYIGNEAFRDCKNITKIVLPQTVKKIDDFAFYLCSDLENINIPATVEYIGENAFRDCALREITIPSNIKKIEYMTFYCCEDLTKVNLHKGLIEIDDEAFARCENLNSITIPSTVTRIGKKAFEMDYSITDLVVLAKEPPILEEGNFGYPMTVYVHSGSVEAYKNAEGWKDFIIESIPTDIETITMPESITISNGVLNNPEGLEITVYDTAGLEIYKGRDTSLTLNGGMYIIHCGKSVKKIAF